jgi:glyceraldehyde 3-phosphate dehydrogenase
VIRLAWEHHDVFELVHLNDITAAESVAYLLKYDSVHGTWGPEVEAKDGHIVITEGQRVARVPYSNSNTLEGVRISATHITAIGFLK